RMGLWPTEPAVRTDLILERAHLFEIGVVAAVEHQGGGRRVTIDLGDMIPRPWSERLQRILAIDFAGRQVEAAVPAEHHRCAALLAPQYDTDLRGGALHRAE